MYLEKVALDYLKYTDLSKIFRKYFLSEQTNKSLNLKGNSNEFLEYREYHYGDDLKSVNWKLFAKTGRLYTKTFSTDISRKVMILLDISKSMLGGERISKLEYSKYLLTIVAYKLSNLGYNVLFSTFDNKIYKTFQISGKNFLQVQNVLTSIRVNSQTDFGNFLKLLPEVVSSNTNLLIISDFLFVNEKEVYDLRLLFPKKDIIFFHIVAEEEINLPRGNNFFELVDPETNLRKILSLNRFYTSYQYNLSKFFEKLYVSTRDSKIPLITFNTSVPYYVTLKEI